MTRLILLDADRASSVTYLALTVPKLVAGGLLISDNAVSHATGVRQTQLPMSPRRILESTQGIE